MKQQWLRLSDELDKWGAAHKQAQFWWRDDDACEAGPALDRLLEVAGSHNAPVALATIPAGLKPSLGDATRDNPLVTIFQHGYAHINHSGPDEAGAWELGLHRGKDVILAELVRGRKILSEAFGDRFVAVVVPPWNRLADGLVGELGTVGFMGVSGFGEITPAQSESGLNIVHCHCDPISWKRGHVFAGEARIMDQLVERLEQARMQESGMVTGYLTHHLDMDDASWGVTERLFDVINTHAAARMVSPKAVFAS